MFSGDHSLGETPIDTVFNEFNILQIQSSPSCSSRMSSTASASSSPMYQEHNSYPTMTVPMKNISPKQEMTSDTDLRELDEVGSSEDMYQDYKQSFDVPTTQHYPSFNNLNYGSPSTSSSYCYSNNFNMPAYAVQSCMKSDQNQNETIMPAQFGDVYGYKNEVQNAEVSSPASDIGSSPTYQVIGDQQKIGLNYDQSRMYSSYSPISSPHPSPQYQQHNATSQYTTSSNLYNGYSYESNQVHSSIQSDIHSTLQTSPYKQTIPYSGGYMKQDIVQQYPTSPQQWGQNSGYQNPQNPDNNGLYSRQPPLYNSIPSFGNTHGYQEPSLPRPTQEFSTSSSSELPAERCSGGTGKRVRTAFTVDQISLLKEEYQRNPYIDRIKRKQLSQILNVNDRQIKIWFQNYRMKMKKLSQKSGENDDGSEPIINIPTRGPGRPRNQKRTQVTEAQQEQQELVGKLMSFSATSQSSSSSSSHFLPTIPQTVLNVFSYPETGLNSSDNSVQKTSVNDTEQSFHS